MIDPHPPGLRYFREAQTAKGADDNTEDSERYTADVSSYARLWSSCTNRIVMHLRQLSLSLLYSFPSVSFCVLCLRVLLCHCFCLLYSVFARWAAQNIKIMSLWALLPELKRTNE